MLIFLFNLKFYFSRKNNKSTKTVMSSEKTDFRDIWTSPKQKQNKLIAIKAIRSQISTITSRIGSNLESLLDHVHQDLIADNY